MLTKGPKGATVGHGPGAEEPVAEGEAGDEAVDGDEDGAGHDRDRGAQEEVPVAEGGRRGQRQGDEAGGERQPAAGGLGVEGDGVRAGAEDGRRGRDVGVPDGGGAGRDPVVESLRQRDQLKDGKGPQAEEGPRERARQPQRAAPRVPQERAECRGQRDERDCLRRPQVHAAERPR